MQTQLISEQYRDVCAQAHREDPKWGTSSGRMAQMVERVIADVRPANIVDYGCGKQSLARALPRYRFIGYDPAIPGLDNPPPPADLVICTDVMEHIEPELLDAVLDDLERVTIKALFLTVATVPAKKILPDGRNAHLQVQPMDWWLPRFMARFDLMHLEAASPGFTALFHVKKRSGNGST